ncbi:dTMP kinase [Candidatus Woesearchaeota archaeon]|nr:dTMP kinase [Candidatus Woesearchaeota archaeon]
MIITFEGIDFCGKSTAVKLFMDYLSKNNISHDLYREPGGHPISENIRNILLNKKSSGMVPEAELHLFLAQRVQNIKSLIPELSKKYDLLLADRFHDSTTAYQGFGRELEFEAIEHFKKKYVDPLNIVRTYLIDISIEEMVRRKNLTNEEADRIESSGLEFYKRVKNGYYEIAKNDSDRVKIIKTDESLKGMKSIDYVFCQIKSDFVNLLESRNVIQKAI